MADSPYIEDDERDDETVTEIVSYLDGELDDTQMLEVEQKLIQDPEMRSHADILSRTWALLDELDEVSASQRFTQDTLATVTAESAEKKTAHPARHLRSVAEFLSRYKVVPCFLMGLLSGLAGLAISERMIETRQSSEQMSINSVLLENFDLLQNIDLYLSVPAAESLREVEFPTDTSRSEDRREQ